MATQAISAYGIQLRLGDGVVQGAAAVTGATNAAPIVVTIALPHAIVDVGLVEISGVLGNTAANGRWVAEPINSTTLVLRGSVGNGIYAGGGGLTVPDTFVPIAEVTDVQDSGATATLVEVSAHDSGGWVSRLPTLISGNAIRLALNFVPTHFTHNATTGLGQLLLTKARRNWLLVFPDIAKTAWALTGFVSQLRVQGPVTAPLTADIVLEMTDEAILAAA